MKLSLVPSETGQKITTGPLKCKMASWCHVSIYFTFVYFLHCCYSEFLAACIKWDNMSVQRRERGHDRDGAIENIMLETFPRSTAMFIQERRGLSLFWRLSECWYALGVWVMTYTNLPLCYTKPISQLLCSSALSLHVTWALMGIIRLWACLHSQSKGVLQGTGPTLKIIQTEQGWIPCGSGTPQLGDTEETFSTVFSATARASLQCGWPYSLSSYTYMEFPSSGHTYLSAYLCMHKTMCSDTGS